MEIIKEFISNYGGEIIFTIISAIFAFLGTALKKIVEDYVKDKKKREIVKDCVKAVEQVYKNLHGSEKLKKTTETATQMLNEKGINITELEMITLIEAALAEFNDAFNKASWEKGIEEATLLEDKIADDLSIEAAEGVEVEVELEELNTAEAVG